MSERKLRIASAFGRQAASYDRAATVQAIVAARLAQRIMARQPPPVPGLLEIGCGTGLLSTHLARAFPRDPLLLTDISPAMLAQCRLRLGEHHAYQLLDGEHPEGVEQKFGLIASSLAVQWFTDLGSGLQRLGHLLAPAGRLHFATLGCDTFQEWRAICGADAIYHGTHAYPAAAAMPWPAGFACDWAEERIIQHHASGTAFLRSLKNIGAAEPASGFRARAPGSFRRLLAGLQDGFSVTYHIIYGEIRRPG